MKIKKMIRKGMTLVELAVVVLILGAIIALVAFNINPGEIKDDTAGLKLKKDSSELQLYLEQYANKFGTYPTEEQGLMALVEKPTDGEIPDNWRAIIRNKSAVLDPWGTPYLLSFDDNNDIAIISLGNDKAEGGSGKASDFNILNENEYPADFK